MSQFPVQHPDYASPRTSVAPPKRSARAWIILLIAWVIGLAVWAIYITVFVYLIFKLLI